MEIEDPDRALYLNTIVFDMKENAIKEGREAAKAASQKYFLHGALTGIIITIIIYAIIYFVRT